MDSCEYPILKPQLADETSALLTEEAGGVCFVDNDVPIPLRKSPLHAIDNLLKRCDIAVHAVYALDSNKDIRHPLSYFLAGFAHGEVLKELIEALSLLNCQAVVSFHGVVPEWQPLPSPAQSHPIMNTCMDQLVVNNNISRLGHTAE